jgi:O-antigen ligase
LGVGFGNYKFLMHDYIPGLTDDLDAHNLYLQWLAETGIVGFAVFFLIMGSFTRIGLRLRNADPVYRMWGIGLCGAIVATLIHGLVDYIFNVSPQFGNLFWLLLALGLCAFEMWRKQSAPLSRGMAAAR